jgi:hypothetical protein
MMEASPSAPFVVAEPNLLLEFLAIALRTSRRLDRSGFHDGYRQIVRRDGAAVRLYTRRGYDWTDRHPAIAAGAVKLRAKSFTLDGEAVVAGADGEPCSDAVSNSWGLL